ncbi:unnamed protein product [Choristocarpus tenellus]
MESCLKFSISQVLPKIDKTQTMIKHDVDMSRLDVDPKDASPTSALQRARMAKVVVDRCIAAREALGAATENVRQAVDESGTRKCGTDFCEQVDEEVKEQEVIASEFAHRMEELASVAPELSRLLLDLTMDALKRSSKGAHAETGPGVSKAADAVDFRALLQVVPPTLASLLSFDHLRASATIAPMLTASLVNLAAALGAGPSSSPPGSSQVLCGQHLQQVLLPAPPSSFHYGPIV